MKLKITTQCAVAIMALGSTVCTAQASKAVKQQNPGLNLQYMDKTVKPGNDFFRYVNGLWVDKTEIPADKTRWGSFDELRENTNKDALAILKAAAADKNLSATSDQGKAANLYKSIMDTVARNKAGIAPLKPYLAKIDKVKNVKDLQALLTEMEPEGGLGFFGVYVGADAKDSNKNTAYLGIASLGLPDREYYVSQEADSKEKRELYVKHVAKMLGFLGSKDPAKEAKNILDLETAFAQPMFDRVESRDDRKSYNPMTVAELQKITPAINWDAYFKGIGISQLSTIVVSQPKYMAALQTILSQNKVEEWKSYLRWTLLRKSAGMLSNDVETANWEFYSKTLRGAIKQEARDKRALQTINGSLGEALGKLYVGQKFPPEAKAKAESMIANVIKAYENRINNLPWMAKATREAAIEKLHRLTIKVGYPDKWEDYSALTIAAPANGGTFFSNMKSLSAWRHKENIVDLNKPVDKTEWGMAPQVVNAYYNPSYNEIVFPAAILQPPFYDYKADEAVNYGGIGAVIGHEISHGFDDSGSRYNADGNLINWWGDADLTQFTGLADNLATQYSQLQPLPGIYVDGKFTLGENIGDLGGVNAAYDGLQLYLKEKGNPGLIDGFTPEQRFFISWATIWRTKMRDEAIKNQVKTDPHSPGMYRAYVPLQNVEAFYKAFGIKPGDAMYVAPEKRVNIW